MSVVPPTVLAVGSVLLWEPPKAGFLTLCSGPDNRSGLPCHPTDSQQPRTFLKMGPSAPAGKLMLLGCLLAPSSPLAPLIPCSLLVLSVLCPSIPVLKCCPPLIKASKCLSPTQMAHLPVRQCCRLPASISNIPCLKIKPHFPNIFLLPPIP